MASTIDRELAELLDKYEVKQLGKRDNRAEALSEEERFIEQFNSPLGIVVTRDFWRCEPSDRLLCLPILDFLLAF